MNCFIKKKLYGTAICVIIKAQYVFNTPKDATVIYVGILTTSGGNVKAPITIAKTIPEPGILCFDMAYAPILDTKIVNVTFITVTNKLLNMYLVKGTVVPDIDITKSVKFLNVGLLTKNLGGNKNSSSYGLKAVLIKYIKGNAVKATNASIKVYTSNHLTLTWNLPLIISKALLFDFIN